MATDVSYRELLKKEFVDRQARNARYSLRAFARDVDLSVSRLSEIFSGSSNLSVASAKKVSTLLGYSKFESSYFCDLVEIASSRNLVSRKAAELRLRNRSNVQNLRLSKELFSLISEWHHFAILELSTFEDYEDKPAWIADMLQISEVQAKVSLQKMERLGLMERNKDGKLIAKNEFTFTPDGIPSRALRYAHEQLIQLGLKSLHRDSIEIRDFSNMMISVSEDQMEDARDAIRNFRRKFREKLPKSTQKKRLYSLAIQLFPISK